MSRKIRWRFTCCSTQVIWCSCMNCISKWKHLRCEYFNYCFSCPRSWVLDIQSDYISFPGLWSWTPNRFFNSPRMPGPIGPILPKSYFPSLLYELKKCTPLEILHPPPEILLWIRPCCHPIKYRHLTQSHVIFILLIQSRLKR